MPFSPCHQVCALVCTESLFPSLLAVLSLSHFRLSLRDNYLFLFTVFLSPDSDVIPTEKGSKEDDDKQRNTCQGELLCYGQ